MIRANYDPESNSIRAELADCALPVEIYSGHEGHSAVLHLDHDEALQLMNQLAQAIRRAGPAFDRQRSPARARPAYA